MLKECCQRAGVHGAAATRQREDHARRTSEYDSEFPVKRPDEMRKAPHAHDRRQATARRAAGRAYPPTYLPLDLPVSGCFRDFPRMSLPPRESKISTAACLPQPVLRLFRPRGRNTLRSQPFFPPSQVGLTRQPVCGMTDGAFSTAGWSALKIDRRSQCERRQFLFLSLPPSLPPSFSRSLARIRDLSWCGQS